ncbi:MAG: hypothetical protein WDN44_05585 [Sphingomonas sp.]
MAVLGHLALFGLLSAGFLAVNTPTKSDETPIEVSITDAVGLESQAPMPSHEEAAALKAPEEGPPVPETPPPTAEPDPQPISKPAAAAQARACARRCQGAPRQAGGGRGRRAPAAAQGPPPHGRARRARSRRHRQAQQQPRHHASGGGRGAGGPVGALGRDHPPDQAALEPAERGRFRRSCARRSTFASRRTGRSSATRR